jgi:hypothetical protein
MKGCVAVKVKSEKMILKESVDLAEFIKLAVKEHTFLHTQNTS